MSKSITPKYVLEMSGTSYHQTPSAWKGRVPTRSGLERYVMAFVVSTYKGYCNEQIGETFGIEIPSRAVVRENFHGGRILIEWKAPMFQVLPNAADFPEVGKV